jgi:hypothetical protein
VVVVGVLGLVATLASVTRRGRHAGAAVFFLGAAYVVDEASGRASASSVVLEVVGLVVLAELLLWLPELPARGRADVRVVTGRIRSLTAIALGTSLLALVTLAATEVRLGAPAAGGVLAVLAAGVLLALPLLLLRRPRGR